MKRLGVLGNLDENKIGGQIIKTREFVEALNEKTSSFYCTDVSNYNNPFSLVFDIFKLIHSCDTIIIILSNPGYFKIQPLIILFSSLYKKRILEIVIGGTRYKYLKKNKVRLRLERMVNKIYVESNHILKEYENIGLVNAKVLPNFKNIKVLSENEIYQEFINKNEFYVCTFSRIDKYKGIDVAVDIVKTYNKIYDIKIYLDIIGPVDDEYKIEFMDLLNQQDDKIKHIGCINSSLAVETLKKYDVLLFPTKWSNEGFPGSFIDAMAAGLVIAASDSDVFRDIIIDGFNGYLINVNDTERYIKQLHFWVENKENLIYMKKNALCEAKKYTTEVVLKEFWKELI